MQKLFDSKKFFLCVIGSAILSFGLYNIHSLSGVTEGGVLGLTLLLQHWFKVSPAISGFIMNVICYSIGWIILGKEFVKYSFVAGGCFSVFYAIFEQFPPIYPELAHMPFVAALVGAAFVGIGVGVCVRSGGAPGGDDALAMALSKMMKSDIRWIYLASDLIVLLLSLTYLDYGRVSLSLLTVILSGQLIGFVQKIHFKKKKRVKASS